jgi:hypothetical protein
MNGSGAHTWARERTILSTLIVLLIVLWVGFVVHRSPRFPGSLTGGVLAVSAAILMVVFSIAYVVVKRIPASRRKIGVRISMGDLLTWHVYTSAIGAILALLHTGHRFESDLGIALTSTMLLTVFSGYVGRHLLGRVSLELHEKRDQLAKIETAYNEAVRELARSPDPLVLEAASHSMFSGWRIRSVIPAMIAGERSQSHSYRAVRMTESIAELEYSIKTHDRSKRVAAHWLKLHIAAALGFYVLLALHIWASIHFGLRWFE